MNFIPVKVTKDKNIFSSFQYKRGGGEKVFEPLATVAVSGTVYDSETETWYIPFCETEVTNAQYAAVMGAPAPEKGTENLPKVNISATEIAVFMNRLSVLMYRNEEFMASMKRYNNGKTANFYFRLPTPVEWEFAARGGCVSYEQDPVHRDFYRSHPYPLDIVSDYEVLFEGKRAGKARPVKGRRKPNPVGLYDMLGNVSEMCGPLHYSDYAHPGRTGGIPVCGGNYALTPKSEARASLLNESAPYSVKGEEYRSGHVGFRPIMGSAIRHKSMSLAAFCDYCSDFAIIKTRERADIKLLMLLRDQQQLRIESGEGENQRNKAEIARLENEIQELERINQDYACKLENAAAPAETAEQTVQPKESTKAAKRCKSLEVENYRLKQQLTALKKQKKEYQLSMDAERKLLEQALASSQESMAYVHSTQVKRAQSGILLIANAASRLGYYEARLKACRTLLKPLETVSVCKHALAICEEDVKAVEADFLAGCELLADVPQEVVDAELLARLNELKEKKRGNRLHDCLMLAAEYFKEYRQNQIPPPTDALKEKLSSVR